jgi:hypothetical protein
MKCPQQTSACHVRKIGESKEVFGIPPVPGEVYYRCASHGFFIYLRESNGLTTPGWGPLNRDSTELKSVHERD